jgi:hypothetical protein
MRTMATQGPTVLEGTSRPRWFGAVVAILVLGGLAAGFAGYDALSRMAVDKVRGGAFVGAFVVALVAALLLAIGTSGRLVIDADGIELRRRGKATRIRWSEPHDIYYDAMTGSDTPAVESVTVRTADGRRIDVGKISVPERPNANVAKVVEQYSTTANWPRIQERLEAGEEVEFGAARMSRKTLNLGELTHTMEHPICFQIERGVIQVGVDKKWQASTVRVRDVANYPCLLRAIGQVAQARPPA